MSNSGKKPDEEGCAADGCVTHATCNTNSNPTKCQCDTGYTATPTTTPTMCKFKLNCNKLEMNGINRSMSPSQMSLYVCFYNL